MNVVGHVDILTPNMKTKLYVKLEYCISWILSLSQVIRHNTLNVDVINIVFKDKVLTWSN